MGHIRVDGMPLEMLCADWRDFRAKSIGAVCNLSFTKNGVMVAPWGPMWHHRGLCEKAGIGGYGLPSKECVCIQCKVWHP